MKEENLTSTTSQIGAVSVKKDVPASLLSKTVADLHTMSPWPGVGRYLLSTILLYGAMFCAYRFNLDHWLFYVFSIFAGLFFAATAVTSHDAIHHTLTGNKWFDEISARIATWPALWPHGLYSELHKLHHKMNGVDARDPERVTFTEAEYSSASGLKRFFIRYQLLINVFIGGGIGMIVGHLFEAKRFASQSRGIRRQFLYDVLGIFAISGALYGAAAANNQLRKALLLYFIIERVGGGLLQLRAHLEHYGISSHRSNYFATQLYSCRNIETNYFMSWLMNGLNFHSLHHAFPKIPFYHLREATLRINRLLNENGIEELPKSRGYVQTFIELSGALQFVRLSEPTGPNTQQQA